MSNIDENVVALRFDNKQFEQGASETMSTLEKLKAKLDFKGASKSFDDIDKAANRISFNGLLNGADGVVAKFSYMQMTIQHQLDRIVDYAVNTGTRITKALTVDPIKTGLDEYGIKMNSIQVIKSNTNDSMKQITKSLDELNTYADNTIYNFAQMTSNVGKFVAQGLNIKQATKAIQGLANLAGASGASAQDMARATYQMSQALGGTIRKIDWNSLRNANMATTKLKETIIAVAENHGIAIKKMIKEEGNFEETLSKGWLSGDLFTEAMNMYSDAYSKAELKQKGYSDKQIKMFKQLAKDAKAATTEVKTLQQLWDVLKETAQSGWTQSWEYILGDFETAKKDLSALQRYLSDIINKQADERNAILEVWNKEGGRASAIEAIKNAWKGLLSVIKPVKEGFREIFPRKTGQDLIEITKRIENFTKKLILSKEQQEQLKEAAKGVFSVFKLGVDTIKALAGSFGIVLKSTEGAGSNILELAGNVGRALQSMTEYAQKHNVIAKAAKASAKAIANFVEAVKTKIDLVNFEKLYTIFNGLWNIITKVGNKVQKVIIAIGRAMGEAVRTGDMKSILDLVNSGIITSILLGMRRFLKNITGAAKGTKGFIKNIKDTLDTVKGSLEEWQKSLRAKSLLTIASAIGILAASLLVLSMVKPERLNTAVGAITIMFAELAASMALMNKIDFAKNKGSVKAIAQMVILASAVFVLALAAKKISSLSYDEITRGLIGVGVCIGYLIATVKIIDKAEIKKSMKGVSKLIVLGAALYVMGMALEKLGKLSWTEIGHGIVAMGGVMAELLIFQAIMLKLKPKGMMRASSSLILIGAAMEIFADVMHKMGSLKYDQIGRVLTAMGGILAIVAIFDILAGKGKHMVRSSAALVILAAGMEIMADIMQKIGAMKMDNIGKALTGFGGILAIVAIFDLIAGNSKRLVRSSAALVILAAGMEILTDVVAKLGAMEWEGLSKAVVGIGCLVSILTAFNVINGTFGNMAKTGAGLILVASGLQVLTGVLVTLGKMKVDHLIKSLVSLGLALTIISGFGAIGMVIAPGLLSLAGAMTALGAACLLFGAGVSLAGAGFSVLATTAAAGAVALVAALTTITVGILGLKKEIIEMTAMVVVAFVSAIAQAVPQIVDAVVSMIAETIASLATHIPKIVKDLMVILVGILDGFAQNTPKIVDDLMVILVGFIEGVANRMPELVHAVTKLFTAFFKAVAQEFKSASGNDLLSILEGIALITAITIALGTLSSLIPSAMVGVVGLGAIMAELALVLAAIGALSKIPGLKWLIDGGGDLLMHVGKAIGKFVGGIIGGIAEGIMDSAPQVAKDLSRFMKNLKPFLDGAKDIDPSISSSVGQLAKAILIITGTELVNKIAGWITGSNNIDDFGKDLVKFGKYFKQFADEVIGIDPVVVTAASTAASALAAMAKNAPRKGGLVSLFKGDNSLDKFGKQLPAFAKHIVAFSKSLNGLNITNINAATGAMKSITAMAKSIPNSGGLVSLFKGDNNIAKFGKALLSYGKSLAAFSEYGAKINLGGVDNAAKAFKKLASKGVGELTSSFSKASPKVTHATNVLIGKIVSALKAKQKDVNAQMRKFVSGMMSEIEKQNPKSSGATMMNKFILGIKSKRSDYKKNVKVFLTTFDQTIENNKKKLRSNGSIMAITVINGLKSQNKTMKQTGAHAVDGYIQGLSSKDGALRKAAKLLGKNTLDALRKELDIHSPSRETKAIGKFAVDGYIEPINSATTIAWQAGAQLGAATLSGLSSALTNIPSLSLNTSGVTGIASSLANTVKDLVGVSNAVTNVNKSLAMTRKQMLGFFDDMEFGKYVARDIMDIYAERAEDGSFLKGAAYEAEQAKEAVYGYALELYKVSDLYKQDKATIKQDRKAYEQTFKDRAKVERDAAKERKQINADYEKDAKKIQNKIDKLTKEGAKKNAKQIKNLNEQLKDLKKKREDRLKDSNKNLQKNLKTANKNIESAAKKLEKDSKDVQKHVKQNFWDLAKSLKSQFAQIVNVLNTPFGGFSANLSEFKNTVTSTLGEVAEGMSGMFDEFKFNGEEAAESTSETFTETVRDLGDGIKEILTRSKEVSTTISSTVGNLKKIDVVKNLTDHLDAEKAFNESLSALAKAGLDQRIINEISKMGAAQGMAYAESFKTLSTTEISAYNQKWIERNEELLKRQAEASKITKEQIMKGLDDQIATEEMFDSFISQLKARGLSKEALAQIEAMGAKEGSEYAQAFLSMSNEELATYGQKLADQNAKITKETYLQNIKDNIAVVQEYANKLTELANTKGAREGFKKMPKELAESLATMGSDAYSYIDMYLSMSKKEWNEFIKLYGETKAVPGEAANKVLGFVVESFKGDGGKGAETLTNDLTETVKKALSTVYIQAAEETTKQTGKQTKKQAENAGNDTVDHLTTAMSSNSNKNKVKESAKELGHEAYKGLNTYISKSKGSQLAGYICQGLINGLVENRSRVVNAAVSTAVAAYRAACEALEINSPSKKFEDVGMYSDLGWAKGMYKYAKTVQNGAREVGTQALDAVKTAISTISDVVDGNMNLNPVITPVLDLTRVGKDILNLDNMTSRTLAMSIEADRHASRSNTVINKDKPEDDNRPNQYIFNQNNYSPKALSRLEIYQQTKSQFAMMKGVVESK